MPKPNQFNTLRNLRLYYDRRFNKKSFPKLVKEYRRGLSTVYRLYQKCDKKWADKSERQILNLIEKEVKNNA